MANPSLGYQPESPSYYDPVSSSLPNMFPGQAFGSRHMPAYVASVPTPRDFMSRDSGYVGNSAFSAPLGIGFGNQMMNFAMQGMVMPMLASAVGLDYQKMIQNLAPIAPPNMPFSDWMDSRRRYDAFSRPEIRQQVLGNAYSWDALGTYNTLVQDFWDSSFNPAGSSMQTAQSIYGRFGASFEGDHSRKLDRALQMYNNLNDSFSSSNAAGQKFFDFNKSFGFDRPQLVDMLDTAMRRGVGGLSFGNIEQMASDPATFKEKSGEIAKFMSAAQDIFGRDKGFDELTSLVGKALANFQTVDSTRATDLLQKIQATSRALNISGDAMAEYVAMFNDLDRSLGGAGVGNTMQSLRAAGQGSTIAAVQREQGGTLTDQNEAMVVAAQMGAGATNSYYGKWSLGFASSFSRLSDSQKSMKTKDGRTINEVMEDYKRAWNSGDVNAIAAEQAKAERALAGSSVLSAEDLRAGASRLTRGDRAAAERFMDENGFASAGEALQIGAYRKSIKENIAGRFDQDGSRALLDRYGGMSVIEKLMASDLGTEGLKNRGEVAKEIKRMFGNRISVSDAEKLGGSFAAQFEQEHREANVKGKIFSDAGDGESAFDAVIALGSNRAKSLDAGIDSRRQSAEIDIVLGQRIKGSIMKGINLKDLANQVPKQWDAAIEAVMENAKKAKRTVSKDQSDWTAGTGGRSARRCLIAAPSTFHNTTSSTRPDGRFQPSRRRSSARRRRTSKTASIRRWPRTGPSSRLRSGARIWKPGPRSRACRPCRWPATRIRPRWTGAKPFGSEIASSRWLVRREARETATARLALRSAESRSRDFSRMFSRSRKESRSWPDLKKKRLRSIIQGSEHRSHQTDTFHNHGRSLPFSCRDSHQKRDRSRRIHLGVRNERPPQGRPDAGHVGQGQSPAGGPVPQDPLGDLLHLRLRRIAGHGERRRPDFLPRVRRQHRRDNQPAERFLRAE